MKGSAALAPAQHALAAAGPGAERKASRGSPRATLTGRAARRAPLARTAPRLPRGPAGRGKAGPASSAAGSSKLFQALQVRRPGGAKGQGRPGENGPPPDAP